MTKFTKYAITTPALFLCALVMGTTVLMLSLADYLTRK